MSILRAIAPARDPKRNPRDNWPEWTDADTWELGPEPEDTRDHAVAFNPSPRELAFDLGYGLGVEREDALPPARYSRPEARDFRRGMAAGRREWDRRLDEMYGSAEFAEFGNGITDRDMYPYGGVS